MQVAKNDFLIVSDEKQKKMLLHVTNTDPFKAVLCNDNKKDKDLATYVEFEKEDVVANLGNKPPFGNVYGVPIESVKLQFEEKEPWHRVRFFKRFNETEISLIWKALKKTSDILLQAKMFSQERPIDVHIKELKGPHAGTYRVKTTKEEAHPDLMTLFISEFSELEYTCFHELGHGVWAHMMDDEQKARWITMFYKNISLIDDLKEKIQTMRGELINAGSIKAYLSDLEEDDSDILQHVVKHIKKQYNVKPMHLNILIAAGNDLTEIWPKKIAGIPQANVLVTEYSTTDPEELWCEAFAHYYHPSKQLAKSVTKLMEQTITASRYGSNHKGKYS